MKKIYTLLAAAAIAASSQAQTIQKYTATKSGEWGIPYTLPTTAVDITIETQKTVKQPGEFYKYSRRYFSVENPITEPSTTVEVKSVAITTRGVPDPEERYVVTFKPGYTPFMMLSADDIPLAINTEELYSPATIELPTPQAAAPTPLETAAARQAMNEEIMQSQSIAKRAELAAARIFELRQSRNDIITGQADQMPPDGKAMELVLNSINDQEAALMAMFIGTTKTSTDVRTITVTPEADDEGSRRVIARLSPVNGLVDADDLSGTPIYLSYTVTERPEVQRNAKGEEVGIPKDGFVFRLPGKATVTVSNLEGTLATSSVQMAQFGVINGLKPNTFTDKKAPTYAIFNPTTGAIVELGSVEP